MINAEASPALVPRTILVVEDEVLIRLAICDVLRDYGVRVVEAASAEEAYMYVKTDPSVHLVFTDVRMPGAMDGIGLARQLMSEFPHISVVLTSGHLFQGDVGEEAVLFSKPYPLEETAARIIAMLDRKSA